MRLMPASSLRTQTRRVARVFGSRGTSEKLVRPCFPSRSRSTGIGVTPPWLVSRRIERADRYDAEPRSAHSRWPAAPPGCSVTGWYASIESPQPAHGNGERNHVRYSVESVFVV